MRQIKHTANDIICAWWNWNQTLFLKSEPPRSRGGCRTEWMPPRGVRWAT